jgi:hypothetical protein
MMNGLLLDRSSHAPRAQATQVVPAPAPVWIEKGSKVRFLAPLDPREDRGWHLNRHYVARELEYADKADADPERRYRWGKPSRTASSTKSVITLPLGNLSQRYVWLY